MSKKNSSAKTRIKTPKTKPQAETHAAPAPEAPVETKPAKTTRKATDAKAKKLIAIDAAAQVLAAKGEPMTAPELIEAMAAQGLWSSTNGRTTPAATLYSALLREITTKGKESRFSRPARGKFARTAKA
jgi:hypothetical protein